MSYKSELDRFRESFGDSLSLLTLDIAMEVEDAIGRNEVEISDEDYENICNFAYQLYMKDQTDKTVYKLIEWVFKYLEDEDEEGNNIERLLKYSPYEFLCMMEWR